MTSCTESPSRILIVANRLPITVSVDQAGEVAVERSAGGLATGLQGPHEESGGLWIGWPGTSAQLDERQRARLDERLAALRLVSVELTADEARRYYEGFANGVLWPLFHYLVDQIPLAVEDWDVYEAVNRRFADAVAEQYRPGDIVWVQDYQLLLVPGLLRERVPDARIGFFLHIPFPDSEIFRMLPARTEVLEGLLGADLVGFHTAAYVRHFATALTHIIGATVEMDRVFYRGRETHLGAFPMGVDAAAFAALGDDPEIVTEAAALKRDGARLVVGIDRLDYTKGIPRRLLAFERLLERHPELRERIRLVQVAVPSRTGVEAYQDFRSSVDQLMGRINGAYATPSWVPVHYMYRSLGERDVAALYRAADVMLVTPIRDGMNLVAKEFVAARTDGDGVLVLSEFAGAAQELAEALHVNPYDVDRTGETIFRALTMDDAERRSRMAALRRRVEAYDVHRWAQTFLRRLERIGRMPRRLRPSGALEAPVPIGPLQAAERLLLLLDYDGTLVPLTQTLDDARPDHELLELLRALAARPGTEVHVVSGRPRATVNQWLGGLPVWLHAEHGFWSRSPSGEWVGAEVPIGAWRDAALATLRDFSARTPGTMIEEKTAGFAWHYRLADPDFGPLQANELRLSLNQLLSNEPIEVLGGHKVIEVRPHGIHKGRVVTPLLGVEGRAILAIGDDRTDEDLFEALPADAVTVRVGGSPTRARYRVDGVPEVHAILRALL